MPKNNNNTNKKALENLTQEELIAKYEASETALDAVNAKLEASETALSEANAKLEASETALDEALEKIEQLSNRVSTGEVTVEHDGSKYTVVPKFLGTLNLKKAINADKVSAEDLHNYPDLIAEYVSRGSGFLKLKGA